MDSILASRPAAPGTNLGSGDFSVKNISDVAVLIDSALLRKWTVQ